jgi:hypothetical protein
VNIARPFHVHIRDVNRYSLNAPRSFPVSSTFFHYSFAETTQEKALEAARFYCDRAFKSDERDRVEVIDIQVRECVEICESCKGVGGKWGRDSHWRKCRTCSGSPFRFDPGFGFTVTRAT